MRIASLAQALFVLPIAACGGDPARPLEPDAGAATNNVSETENTGKGDQSDAGEAPRASEVTWHGDVAPILYRSCVGCHQSGGIAPFALGTYAQAFPFGESIAYAASRRKMPPWGAQDTDECSPRFGWQDDLRLSDKEIQMIQAWVEDGTPEGDPTTAVDLPRPASLELKSRDVRLTIPSPFKVSGTKDRFVCFSIDPKLAEDKWLTATQVNPGNAAIVHHVLTYLDKGGTSAALAADRGYYDCFGGAGVEDAELLSAWAPGGVPLRTPADVGVELPAGSRLVVNVHYHPTGSGDETDATTSIDLEFAAKPPAFAARIELIGNFERRHPFAGLLEGPADPPSGATFLIPADAEVHTETMRFIVPPGFPKSYVWSVGTHMHYVGTDMKIELTRGNTGDVPSKECLIQTPVWDFNWQRSYAYAAPLEELPTIKVGDQLTLRCTYNNSVRNPFVRSALADQGLSTPRDVKLGEETLDEMCLGVFGIAFPRVATP
ncbi:MAG: hypothetical protein RJA70_2392 [Pseudomonadota bacterium]|jgi:hypothetical protein